MEQEAVYFWENSMIKIDSFKYFIGYRHYGNTFPSPLCIKLPQKMYKQNVLIKIINT